jgi:hypothetical protein
MASRKNLFRIGRRRGDENQLTEMLAYVCQEQPEIATRWLTNLAIGTADNVWDVDTQFVLPSGKRPDLIMRCDKKTVAVESKLESGFGATQLDDYLDYLEGLSGERALVIVTKYRESGAAAAARAAELGIGCVLTRWQDFTDLIPEPGAESLVGDFAEMLIWEGLVKPEALTRSDWVSWNAGYRIFLRLGVLLEEMTPHVLALWPELSASSPGLTKRWVYRLWKSDSLQVGLGFGAAQSDSDPQTEPIIFAMAWNPAASKEEARAAVGGRGWKELEDRSGGYGLLWSNWPTRSVAAAEVITESEFAAQVAEAVAFLGETTDGFAARGYPGLERSAATVGP